MTDKKITDKLNKDYWANKLVNFPDYALFSTGFETESRQDNGQQHTSLYSLPDRLAKSLLALGKSKDINIYQLVAASTVVLIRKYAHDVPQIFLATPPFKEEEKPVEQQEEGMVYLSLEPDFQGTVRMLLKSIYGEVNEAFQHQSYRFKDFVTRMVDLNPANEALMFQLALFYSEVNISSSYLSKMDLVFEMQREDDQFTLLTKYNPSRCNKEYAGRLSMHLVKVLADIVGDINAPLKAISLLKKSEEERILTEFNRTTTAYPRDQTIASLFQLQAAKTPDKKALIFENNSFTYQELNKRANRLANYLRNTCNIGAGDLVVTLLNRSDLYIVSILGILKSGAAYVPIDPALPKDRIRLILDDLSSKALITVSDFIFDLEDYEGELIGLDIQEDDLHASNENPSAESAATDAAYIMYTSGTTGRPKGVVVAQRSVVRLVKNTNFVALDENARLLMTGAVAFDATTFEVWGMLLNGGELHLLSQDDLLNTERLYAYIYQQKISHMWFTSSWFNQLVNTNIDIFGGLKYLVVGGEKISPHHINKVMDIFPSVQVVNGYGPTENTTFSACYNIEEKQTATCLIGKPIANSTVYILDEWLHPVPVGVVGEIYLGGDGLAKGYLNHPELTEEKFIKHPFVKGERLYRSGDKGHWQDDGNIVFIGRNDHQIKLRGFRIELEEIVKVLTTHTEVSQAVVIFFKNSEHGDYLAAYIISDRPAEELDLKKYLRQMLPDYMIPAYFLNVDSFPLTANGKLNERKLPDPLQLSVKSENYLAPESELEQKLATIWQTLFPSAKIGVHDNFFDLGGHSITAIKMLHRIHATISTEVQINAIFSYPTIALLAKSIEKMEANTSGRIPATEPKELYDTSYSQKRFWMVEQMGGGYVGYNVPSVYLFESLNIAAFENAIHALIERHEILRTTFVVRDTVLKQKIHTSEDYDFNIVHVDLSEDQESELKAREITFKEISQPIDLEKGPLLKAKLFKLDKGGKYLFYALTHHIISDSESIAIIFRELLTLYDAYCKGRPNPLKPLRIQYKDFAEWQNKLLENKEENSLQQYWHRKMGGAVPELNLPLDIPRSPEIGRKGDSVREFLKEDMQSLVENFSNKHQVSLFVTLLTAYYILLYRYTGKEDIIIGAPVAGRGHIDLEDQIGCYINMLPLRITLNAEDSVAEVLKRVNTTTLEAIDHQEYPFELLVEDLQIKPLKSGSTLFDASFSLQVSQLNDSPPEGEEPDAQALDSNYRVAHVDLLLQAWKFSERVLLCFDYDAALFYQDTILLMKDRYIGLLKQMLSDENLKITDIAFGNSTEKVSENEFEIDLNF